MDDQRTTPDAVRTLPLDARPAAYHDAHERLEQRLELPGA